MAELYFVDSAHDIVDEWMKSSGDGEGTNEPQFFPEIQEERSNIKAGLGLGSKATKRQIASHDQVAARLFKKKKAAKHSDLDGKAFEENFADLHGAVEEDFEESKTALMSGKSKAEDTKRTKRAPKEAEGDDVQVMENPTSTSQEPFDATLKPKRIKTRSKQKNIRRDNRAASAKPSHLQIGAKDYRGRPLTPTTKQFLGLPTKPNWKKKGKDRDSKTATRDDEQK